MANVTGDVIKSNFVLWVDQVTPASTGVDDYSETEAANMRAVALCQSYNIDSSAETSTTTELAATNPEWQDNDVVVKSYTVSFDGLLFREDASGDYSYDDQNKFEGDALKLGDVVFFALTDYDDGSLTNTDVKEYGKAVVTSRSKSGTVNDQHTYSITLTGKGKLFENTSIPS